MRTREGFMNRRPNVWLFLVLTLALRHVADTRHCESKTMTLAELQVAMRAEPDEVEWHDRISDYYFLNGEFKRSLFHRREAIRILDREELEIGVNRDGVEGA